MIFLRFSSRDSFCPLSLLISLSSSLLSLSLCISHFRTAHVLTELRPYRRGGGGAINDYYAGRLIFKEVGAAPYPQKTPNTLGPLFLETHTNDPLNKMNYSVLIVLAFFASLAISKPMEKPTQTSADELDLDLFLGSIGDGHFANVDVDGVETMAPKKSEKLPGQKKMKPEFQQPEGVAPEFTGAFMSDTDAGVMAAEPSTQRTDEVESADSSDSDSDVDYFGEAAASPVSNPALTYLSGANFDNVAQPKCQMLGCTGPIPNDGSYAAMSASLENKACSQIFVAMNGCTDNKGYPMGMLCSVCCDCANSFVDEMKKTFGYKAQVDTSVFSV